MKIKSVIAATVIAIAAIGTSQSAIANQRVYRGLSVGNNGVALSTRNPDKFYVSGVIYNQSDRDYNVKTVDYTVKDGDRTVVSGSLNIYRNLRPGESFTFEKSSFSQELGDRWHSGMRVEYEVYRAE